MYVCICNALTDRDVARCRDGGAASPEDVYKAVGCRPNCGVCREQIETLIREAPAAAGQSAG